MTFYTYDNTYSVTKVDYRGAAAPKKDTTFFRLSASLLGFAAEKYWNKDDNIERSFWNCSVNI